MNSKFFQFDEHACGLAAIRMAMCYASKDWRWRNAYLNSHPPYSLEELEREALGYGFRVNFSQALLVDFAYPDHKKRPFLALLKNGENRTHLVLIRRIRKEKITILDPAEGKIKMEKPDFLRRWTGIYGTCFQFRKDPPPKPQSFFPYRGRLWSYLLLFLEELLIGFGLFFLSNAPGFAALGLLMGSFVCEGVRRLLLFQDMRRFDAVWLPRIYSPNPAHMKENYERYNEFKTNAFASFSQVVTQFSAALLIIVVAGIGNPSFFLASGAVCIALYGLFLFTHSPLIRRKKQLTSFEEELFQDGDESRKKVLLSKLSSGAYSYGRILLLRQIGLYAFVFLFSLIPVLFLPDIGVGSYLFYLFSLLFVGRGAQETIEYALTAKEREQSRGYFQEYFAKETYGKWDRREILPEDIKR